MFIFDRDSKRVNFSKLILFKKWKIFINLKSVYLDLVFILDELDSSVERLGSMELAVRADENTDEERSAPEEITN